MTLGPAKHENVAIFHRKCAEFECFNPTQYEVLFMYIIAGLGNPGKNYENTRHNVGFNVIDFLANELNININNAKHKALTGSGYIDGEKVLLMKPVTYMNLSGEAIIDAVNFYKIDPTTNLIVIYDDISLDVGKLRIRAKGSAGGHNGIKSIINHLGSDTFKRIKVGVGNKPAGYDLADYVLGHFTKDEKVIIDDASKNASNALKLIVSDNFDKAMNLYN